MLSTILDLSTDGHVHTFLCNHAVGQMEDYVRSAIDKKLQTLVFLEHMEAGIQKRERTWLDERDFDLYLTEGERLQKKYADRIRIKLGVEAGYNRGAATALQRGLSRYQWDKIGLSCHFYLDQGRSLNLLSRNPESLRRLAAIGSDQVLAEYFAALLEGLDAIPCTTLCHLDAALRHLPDLLLTDAHCLQIEALLARMQQKNIALELNTSGYDYRGMPFPAPWILAEAIRKGLRFQAGSDAHHPGDVGRYFKRLPAYLDQAMTGSCKEIGKNRS